MAQALAIVPSAGLDAVPVAVKLVLENALPSGRVSVKYVLNVPARLNAPPRPGNVSTTLQASVPPLADTARYDQRRLGGEPKVLIPIRH